MITNILMAAGFFGFGFLTGMITSAWVQISAYKKHPLDVILLLEKYASKW